MQPRDWRLRVQDILEATNRILTSTAGLTFEEFVANQDKTDAACRNLEIMGEAMIRIPEEIRLRHPELPWQMMRGMRNVMAHVYHAVDLGIVWRTIEEDLPTLLPQLESLLQQESS